jgi:ketosteroid isomerase-like protein
MRSTQDVIDNHLRCFGSRDLDGILSDYSAAAVLFTPEGVLHGTDAIKPLFQRMFGEFSKPGASFVMKQKSFDGEYAFIIWSAETADNVYELATDTFFVQNGEIVAQSFAGKITPRT